MLEKVKDISEKDREHSGERICFQMSLKMSFANNEQDFYRCID